MIEAGHIFGSLNKGSYIVIEPQIDKAKRKKLGVKKKFELAKFEIVYDPKEELMSEIQLRAKIKQMGLRRERCVLVAWTEEV